MRFPVLTVSRLEYFFRPGLAYRILILFCLLDFAAAASPEYDVASAGDSLPLTHKKRTYLISGVHVAGYGGSLLLLNNAWYKGYARTGFHLFNDSREWNQVDKFGHAWSAYNISKVSSAMWKWTGMSERSAALLGAAGSTLFLTGIEWMDAHSAKWGWSWTDMAANIGGNGLYLGQQWLWNEQRIQYKFSFHLRDYNDPVLEQRADDLFGKSWYERMLKDYNAQTYWLSVNVASFLPKNQFPAWLNIAVGYGANQMFGGFENRWQDPLGNDVDRTSLHRTREFYLAPDIDFTKIPTRKKWLRTAFTFLNAFKCPAPSLMLNNRGKLKVYALYF